MLRKSALGIAAALALAPPTVLAPIARADDKSPAMVVAAAPREGEPRSPSTIDSELQWSTATTAPATIRPHPYTLAECLALADRNFPSLWAARARLALAHGQLEEAKWTPWFQWSAQSLFGVMPPLTGSVIYPQSQSNEQRNITALSGLQPFFGFGITGVIPLYTFGKIETARDAAEANVRVSEWDMEKWRQTMRMDVRRAFYGLELARDAKFVVQDALERLDRGIDGVKQKLAKGDTSVSEVDRLRLEAYKQEVLSQSLQAPKGEAYALGALRFMTGVQTAFDIVDEPLRRPDRPLVDEVQYLEAARVLRPDVNMARAGIVARRAQVAYNRAKLFPDFGLGVGADFLSTPSATPQNNVWANDPWNHFYYYFTFGLRWTLDLLPQAARAQQAESQLEETRALERAAFGNAMYEVEKAYADAVEAKTREETWDRAEHIAKQWISIVQDHIDLGTSDEKSLLEPLRAYGSARVQHLTALMDYNLAMSGLAMASGWDSAAP
jgi:outer membrane protein TolC